MSRVDIQDQMIKTTEKILCYHCGQPCDNEIFKNEEKNFCCYGCKVVFELIDQNDLCEYYNIESHPGLNAKSVIHRHYEYLKDPSIAKKLLEFDAAGFSRIRFNVPAIHCSSCIWLLENLQKADKGILRSEVNFNRKDVRIDFDPAKTDLARLASILDTLGYPPRITTDSEKQQPKPGFQAVLKLSIAGFVFGNVMLFSFPEYLGLADNEATLRHLFSWLNLVLSVPVIVYSASDYFKSAIKSFNQKQINIDVPIALGLLALFLRSTYDIVTGFGPGYLDSFTGLVFFLLIGRWFQARTYESLAFDRDFKSYFPLAVQKIEGEAFKSTVIYELKKGDKIRIRNLEIVPADSILLDNVAFIDYSFVTGEARPVKAAGGDLIYAGGRLIGKPVTLIVHNETSQSHLTSLWNNDAFRKKYESRYRNIIDQSARVFTWVVLAIALITWAYWYVTDPSQTWLILTSVLMVACPCALALAAPFTYGSMMRAFGQYGFYLKNADVVERLSVIDSIVFDKTGTITHGQLPNVIFHGSLSVDQLGAVKLLTGYSTHPLSTLVTQAINEKPLKTVLGFSETPGKGIEGSIEGNDYRIGSAEFTGQVRSASGTRVYVSIDNVSMGYFEIQTSVRGKINSMLSRLGRKCTAMLSGDTEGDRLAMSNLFPTITDLKFNQQPGDKMSYIALLQKRYGKVLMVGDGLNDAGALRQADVGIAVTDDTGLFTPGCDGILQGAQLHNLDRFLSLAKSSTRILKTAFVMSFMYNAVALTFAITGHLTPLVAAILMPISSISVVSFSTIAVNLIVKRKLKK
jgi:Cu+-exporting ATPase